MKSFILAFDSFKGTLSAQEVCDIAEKVIIRHIQDAHIIKIPIADGGEGMVDSYLGIMGGRKMVAKVHGPLGDLVFAEYGILPDGSAVMEMASCAGLPLIEDRKDPMNASTYGVGEMIVHAVRQGVNRILLGLGGSATNDCGIGMAAALGYLFFDMHDNLVEPLAQNMGHIHHLQPPRRLYDFELIAACDVDNPLYGPDGAAYFFGRQKGADKPTQALLNAGLVNIAEVIQRDIGMSVSHVPGAGAAGGLGAGIMAFAGGILKPGIEMMLDAVSFDSLLRDADMVLTGEGRIDWQTVHGKVPVGVSKRARRHDVPCIALCGSIGDGAEAVYKYGITAFFSAISCLGDWEEIKKNGARDFESLLENVLRLSGRLLPNIYSL